MDNQDNAASLVRSDALLDRALRAICLTRDYVGEDLLPPIKGWEWFDAGTEIAKAIPHSEWAHQFRLRVDQSNAGGQRAGDSRYAEPPCSQSESGGN